MQVLSDAVIINLSPSQRRIIRDSNYASYTRWTSVPEGSSRARVAVNDIDAAVDHLLALKDAIAQDPAYKERRPAQVIDRIVLRLRDADAMQRRTYGRPSN